MLSSDEELDDEGGIFEQSSVDGVCEATSESSNSPKSSRSGSSFRAFFRHSKSTDNVEANEELARMERIEAILQHELQQAISLRSAQAYRIAKLMLQRQENDIKEAFSEVDWLRAELAELIPNKVIPTYRKRILAKYMRANRKELAARQHYATLALAAAMSDAKNFQSSDDWKHRVENDYLVKKEAKVIKLDKAINRNTVLQKKHEYDYNRAKAILKADYNALAAAWPGVDYSGLISDDGRNSRKESVGKATRSKQRIPAEYCPVDLYPDA